MSSFILLGIRVTWSCLFSWTMRSTTCCWNTRRATSSRPAYSPATTTATVTPGKTTAFTAELINYIVLNYLLFAMLMWQRYRMTKALERSEQNLKSKVKKLNLLKSLSWFGWGATKRPSSSRTNELSAVGWSTQALYVHSSPVHLVKTPAHCDHRAPPLWELLSDQGALQDDRQTIPGSLSSTWPPWLIDQKQKEIF